MPTGTSDVPAQVSPASSVVAQTVPAAPSRAWLLAALPLSGAAELITISAAGPRPPVQARLVAVALADQVGRAYGGRPVHRSAR